MQNFTLNILEDVFHILRECSLYVQTEYVQNLSVVLT
jgi:hypothetical protein